jgi:putative acyl-CoA dehydrogenase
MARLFRESPLNSIWEGSGNVQCLDVLRAIQRDPEVLEIFSSYVLEHAGDDVRITETLDDVIKALRGDAKSVERAARVHVERLALVFQAAVLNKFGSHPTFEAFAASRLGADYGRVLGTLPSNLAHDELISRNMPVM